MSLTKEQYNALSQADRESYLKFVIDHLNPYFPERSPEI